MMAIGRPFQELSIHVFSFFLAKIVEEIISNVQINIGIRKIHDILPHLTSKILTQGYENCTKVSLPWVLPTHHISLF